MFLSAWLLKEDEGCPITLVMLPSVTGFVISKMINRAVQWISDMKHAQVVRPVNGGL